MLSMPLFGKKKAKAEEEQKEEGPKKAQKKGRKAGQKKGKKLAPEKKPSAEVPEQPPVDVDAAPERRRRVAVAPDGAAASPSRSIMANAPTFATSPNRHHDEQEQAGKLKKKRSRISLTDNISDKVASGMRGTIARVLNRVLGEYIEGIRQEDFHFSMSQGLVELSNLKLKPEFFATLNQPLRLVASYVGSIRLNIPLKHLKTKPILVELSQIYATLAPSPDIDVVKLKRDQLAAHDRRWAEATDVRCAPSRRQSRALADCAHVASRCPTLRGRRFPGANGMPRALAAHARPCRSLPRAAGRPRPRRRGASRRSTRRRSSTTSKSRSRISTSGTRTQSRRSARRGSTMRRLSLERG